ncbi:LytTR family DNA-binding domain-containing protein [Rudaea sp.]|uniref:LytR/AlgR family response regulator transcription factor n=1 Tax=Rudaea sp. TaxID=2136325 RepID=UPI00321F88C8
MRRLSVLVVEDEDLARERLARLVRARPEFDVVAVCRNCDEAAAAVATQRVDLALLDIQMPGTDGIGFSRMLAASREPAPSVIFVTAHRRYACTAFEIEADDYLLKPFDSARLHRALDAAQRRLQEREALSLVERVQAALTGTVGALAAPIDARPGRFVVREHGRFLIVRCEEIRWIEADGRDCILHCAKADHRVDGPFADIAQRLAGEGFVQVNRSALVRIDAVASFEEMFKGNLVAILRGGGEVPVSRRFRSLVMQRLAG